LIPAVRDYEFGYCWQPNQQFQPAHLTICFTLSLRKLETKDHVHIYRKKNLRNSKNSRIKNLEKQDAIKKDL
jgi:hypothetical protein